jgi:hypothetical protein
MGSRSCWTIGWKKRRLPKTVSRSSDVSTKELKEAREVLPPKDLVQADSKALRPARASAFRQEVDELAATNPAAAVAVTSARLEGALREVLQGANPSVGRMALGQLIDEAVRQGVLEEKEAAAARSLMRVRAQAVHQNVATTSQAMEFAELAYQIAVSARLASGLVSMDESDPL